MAGDDYARQAIASANSTANSIMMQQMFAAYDEAMARELVKKHGANAHIWTAPGSAPGNSKADNGNKPRNGDSGSNGTDPNKSGGPKEGDTQDMNISQDGKVLLSYTLTYHNNGPEGGAAGWYNDESYFGVEANSGVTVVVGYTTVQPSFGLEKHGGVILVDNATGKQYVSEGGPTGAPSPAFAGLNRFWPGADRLVAALRPFNAADAAEFDGFQIAGKLNMTMSQAISKIIGYNLAVNRANLPYSGTGLGGYNSNSYYASLLRYLNIPVPTPPFALSGVIGRSNTLPVSNP